MIPVVAIVGRPNVGKSTLFNCLTHSQKALVADKPGVTRDRLYGKVNIENETFIVIDTGGMGENDVSGIEGLTEQQAILAIHEAHLILLIVDARAGLVSADRIIAKKLRKLNKSIILVINKSDGLSHEQASVDFHSLGFKDSLQISAAHRQNIQALLDKVVSKIRAIKPSAKLTQINKEEVELENKTSIKVAIIGKPNVGKSTLVNRMLGEERVIVFDMPGTTRESIYIHLERHNKQYILIDTAGVRRKSHVTDKIEKVSVVKALQAIEDCHVVLFLIDAKSNITDQDLHLLGFILDSGKSLIITVNKWDGLSIEQREKVKSELDRRLGFVDFAKIKFISALHGTGVGDLFADIESAYISATKKVPTSKLTELLQKAMIMHQPPMVKNRRIKLRYAHSGGQNPQVIVIHGNQTQNLPNSYIRYLQGFFRTRLKLVGTPIHIELKNSENPYKPSTENKPKFKPHPKAPMRRKKMFNKNI